MYDRYYGVARMTRLPSDPRLRRRASGRAFGTVLLGAMIAGGAASAFVAWRFGFDRLLAPNLIAAVMPPWHVVLWTMTYWDAHFRSSHLQWVVRAKLIQGWILLCAGIVATVVAARMDYHAALTDRSKLTNEKGDADWATPEEVAATGGLPDGYDIHRGYNATQRRRLRAARHAADRSKERHRHAVS